MVFRGVGGNSTASQSQGGHSTLGRTLSYKFSPAADAPPFGVVLREWTRGLFFDSPSDEPIPPRSTSCVKASFIHRQAERLPRADQGSLGAGASCEGWWVGDLFGVGEGVRGVVRSAKSEFSRRARGAPIVVDHRAGMVARAMVQMAFCGRGW